MTGSIDFHPDCSRCAALCCVAFAFDRSEEFGHDKPADSACRHLVDGYGCAIHGRLADMGYGGCVRFDCLGAGQRVTQELFDGGDWQADPALLAPMSAAFRSLRRIHELTQLLLTAASLDLDAEAEAERRGFVAALTPEPGWTRESLAAFDAGPLPAEAAAFLRSLASRTCPV